MTSMEALRDVLAENSRTTHDAIQQLTLAVGNLVANAGAVPGAAPSVLTPQSATQTVRKSSEITVQLSLSM